MKKFLTLTLFIVISLTFICSCAIFSNEKISKDGFYRYVIEKDQHDGDREKVRILNITESAQQQKILVVPEYIGGYPVAYINNQGLMSNKGIWQSENLEKVFIVPALEFVDDEFLASGCPNLKKVINIKLNEGKITSYIFMVYQDGDDKYQSHLYIYRKAFDEIYWDYNGLKEELSNKYYNNKNYIRAANISYLYNFEDAENEGYYWIDDEDYGSIITFIPPDPIREDYTFDGWYKDAECTAIWDFEDDKLPEEITDNDGYPVYQETVLYAKWKIN